MKEGNPFIKGTPAPPESMVGREKQIKLFESYITSTMARNPQSLCIYGQRGIGKTTLLRKFEKITETQKGICVRVDVEDQDTIETFCKRLLLCLRDQLMSISLRVKIKSHFEKTWNILSETEVTYKDVRVKLPKKRTQEETTTLVFTKKLEDTWEILEKYTKAVVFMIDEAEYLQKIGMLRLLRNVFSRLAEQRTGYMVVLSGKLTFPTQMSKEFSPLSRFFHPEKVGLMSNNEIRMLYLNGFKQTNIEVDPMCLDQMMDDAEGHPYVATTTGWYIYDSLPENVKHLSLQYYQENKSKIIDMLASELFEPMYKKVPRSERKLLHTIAEYDPTTPSELAKNMREKQKKIAPLLRRLEARGCIEKTTPGTYKIFHKLFKEYVKEQSMRETLLIPKETPSEDEYKKPMERIRYYLSLLKDPEIKNPEVRKSLLDEMRHSIHYFYSKRRVEPLVVPLIIEVIDLMKNEIQTSYKETFYDYLSLIVNIENEEIQKKIIDNFLPLLEKKLATGATDLEEGERRELIRVIQKIHKYDTHYIQGLIDQAINNEKWSYELSTTVVKEIGIDEIGREELEKIYRKIYHALSKAKEAPPNIQKQRKEELIKILIERIRQHLT